jgi:hypothetical protein
MAGFTPTLSVGTFEQVWGIRDSLRPPTVSFPFGADSDPFNLLGGRSFAELRSQIVSDDNVGTLRGELPQFDLLTGPDARVVNQGAPTPGLSSHAVYREGAG